MSVQGIYTSAFITNAGEYQAGVEPRKWFAVYTRSHHEKRVATYYAERQIEHFLPLYETTRAWSHNRKAVLQLPLFPNYIFVHISRQERTRTLEIPGVISLVGQSNVPAPLPAFEIESLRRGLNPRTCEPHASPLAGAVVRIKAGPLAGMEGVVLRNKNSSRVVITLSMIMRSVSVEVDHADLDFPDMPLYEDYQSVLLQNS